MLHHLMRRELGLSLPTGVWLREACRRADPKRVELILLEKCTDREIARALCDACAAADAPDRRAMCVSLLLDAGKDIDPLSMLEASERACEHDLRECGGMLLTQACSSALPECVELILKRWSIQSWDAGSALLEVCQSDDCPDARARCVELLAAHTRMTNASLSIAITLACLHLLVGCLRAILPLIELSSEVINTQLLAVVSSDDNNIKRAQLVDLLLRHGTPDPFVLEVAIEDASENNLFMCQLLLQDVIDALAR